MIATTNRQCIIRVLMLRHRHFVQQRRDLAAGLASTFKVTTTTSHQHQQQEDGSMGLRAQYAAATAVGLFAIAVVAANTTPTTTRTQSALGDNTKSCADATTIVAGHQRRHITRRQTSTKSVSSTTTTKQGPRRILLKTEDSHSLKMVLSSPLLNDTCLYDKYQVNWNEPALGQGTFGSVHLCYEKLGMEPVALKRLPLSLTDPAAFLTEVQALHQIQQHGGHKHILGLRDLYQDEDSFYLLLDVAAGGELYTDLAMNGAYTEAQAAHAIAQLASALDFLHRELGMIHADLKPENVLLTDLDRTEADVVLIDFGCAARYKNNKEESSVQLPTRSSCSGTSGYWPPERFGCENKQDCGAAPAMDMWSLGVILYILLSCTHPFDTNGTATDDELDQAIVSCTKPPQLPPSASRSAGEGAQDLINQLLTADPNRRLSARQVLEHPWIVQQQQHQLQDR